MSYDITIVHWPLKCHKRTRTSGCVTHRNKHPELPIRGSWMSMESFGDSTRPEYLSKNRRPCGLSMDLFCINSLGLGSLSIFWGFQIDPHWEIALDISIFASIAHPTSSRFCQQTDLQSIISSSILRAQRTPNWGNSKASLCRWKIFTTKNTSQNPSNKFFKPYTAQALGRWWSVWSHVSPHDPWKNTKTKWQKLNRHGLCTRGFLWNF